MNPHYTFSAIIGLGMYGIKNKLELDMPPVSESRILFVRLSMIDALTQYCHSEGQVRRYQEAG